ncbi:hypothetical protein DFJ63DRAFT_336218 [Scheffersomyces coipomensis]|uniref:uncharacterized protein n=1 Tax=Scheffersomyces coipomensis TaxID=1788519 RepID=UPI00315C8310
MTSDNLTPTTKSTPSENPAGSTETSSSSSSTAKSNLDNDVSESGSISSSTSIDSTPITPPRSTTPLQLNYSDSTITPTEPQTPPPSHSRDGLNFLDGSGSSNDSSVNTSPFKLPQSILKNLTPTKARRSNSENHSHHHHHHHHHHELSKIRREGILKARRDKLIKKSKRIHEKLDQLKKINQSIQQNRIQRLTTDYHRAAERRHKYLQDIKRRASTGACIVNASLITNEKIMNDIEPTPSSSNSQTSTESTANNESKFQQYVHDKEVKEKSVHILKSKILTKYEHLSPGEIFDQFGKDKPMAKDITFILQHYGVPHTFDSCRLFFGAFIMEPEFNKCVGEHFRSNPMFNSNLPNQESRNYLKCFIWLLLYKFSHELIMDFEQLLINGDEGDSKAMFIKTWKSYCFVFKIFKQLDYQDLNKMIDSAINTVNTQLDLIGNDLMDQEDEAIEDSDDTDYYQAITNHKQNFLKEKKQLNSLYDQSKQDEFFNDEESQTFLLSLNHELQFNQSLTSSSDARRLHRKKFHIPHLKYLTSINWRHYWFKAYFSQLRNSNKTQSHISMKTGILKLSMTNSNSNLVNDFIDINDVYKSLHILKSDYSHRVNWSSRSELRDLVHSLSIDLYHYYCKTNNISILSQFHSLNSVAEGVSYIQYIKQSLLDIQRTIEKLNPRDYILKEYPQKCLDIIEHDPELALQDNMLIFSHHIQEFETLVSNILFNAYKINSFQILVESETYHIIEDCRNANVLYSKHFVNSPHLLFPRFYKFLKVFKNNNHLDLNNYLHILESTSYNFKKEVDSKALNYFQMIYFDVLVYTVGKWDNDVICEDELNLFYCDKMMSYRYEIKKFIKSNVLTYILSSFNVSDLNNCFNKILESSGKVYKRRVSKFDNKDGFDYEEIRLRAFLMSELNIAEVTVDSIIHVYKHSNHLESVFMSKFTTLLKDFTATPYSLKMNQALTSVFPWCKSVTSSLIMKIRELIVFFTNVYGQIFTWIYQDLGRP